MQPEPGRASSVVKVGGSLLADPCRLARILAGLCDPRSGPVVVVPGGGPYADAVRADQAALGFDDARAHRLALDAMGRMATHVAGLEPALTVAATVPACAAILAAGGTPVWDPVALRAGHPGIPESWDVTSDSLALWLAAEIGAAACILIKSVPPPPGMDWTALAGLGFVDAAFPVFARAFPGRIVLRGPAADGPARAAA